MFLLEKIMEVNSCFSTSKLVSLKESLPFIKERMSTWPTLLVDQLIVSQIIHLTLATSSTESAETLFCKGQESQIKVSFQIHLLSTDPIYVFPFA